MKYTGFIFLIILSLLISCKTSEKSSATLFSVKDNAVSIDEFEYVYSKNNLNNDSINTEEDIKNYLDLYVNFKLKVQEAIDLGLDTSKAFVNEYKTYRDQLAEPYLAEDKVTEQLVKEAYERLKEEIRASHILMRLTPEAEPEDTLEAYNKLMEIREEAIQGADFSVLASKNSYDPSGKDSKGDLGYFTALQMVYPFESGAYKTAKGDVSMPVRTRFGYHIIKVTDRRPARGEVKVSHIMIKTSETMSENQLKEAKLKIDEIYQKVNEDTSQWKELCSQFSEDDNSRYKGGEIEWFGSTTRQMVTEFADVAFSLENVGDISEPVSTRYGWHIIKLDGKKSLGSFEEEKEEIKPKIKKIHSKFTNRVALIKRLKEENKLEEFEDIKKKTFLIPDSTLLEKKWANDANHGLGEEVLFKIKGSPYVVKDFLAFVENKQEMRKYHPDKISSKHYASLLYNRYLTECLIAFEKDHMEEKYRDFRMIAREYKEGILLFQMMDDKVWSKSTTDSSGLAKFYESNIDRYQWKERVDAVVFNAYKQEVIDSLKKIINQVNYQVGDVKMIKFISGEDKLKDGEHHIITALIPKFRKDDQLKLKIKVAATDAEKQLNEKRVEVIKSFLLKHDFDSSRIITEYVKPNNRNSKITLQTLTTSKKVLEETFIKEDALALKVEEGMFERGDHPILDELEWKVGEQQISKDGRIYYVVINKVIPPGAKKLEGIKGVVITDYQDALEQEWIGQLKQKYAINIDESALEKVYKNLATN